jgi:hypothetical protein
VFRPGFLQVPIIFWNNAFALLSAVSLPHQECSVTSFYVKHAGECPGQVERRLALHPGRRRRRTGSEFSSPVNSCLHLVCCDCSHLSVLAELSDKWKVTHLKVRHSQRLTCLPCR